MTEMWRKRLFLSSFGLSVDKWQIKRDLISRIKTPVYKLPHDLPNDLRQS